MKEERRVVVKIDGQDCPVAISRFRQTGEGKTYHSILHQTKKDQNQYEAFQEAYIGKTFEFDGNICKLDTNCTFVVLSR